MYVYTLPKILGTIHICSLLFGVNAHAHYYCNSYNDSVFVFFLEKNRVKRKRSKAIEEG